MCSNIPSLQYKTKKTEDASGCLGASSPHASSPYAPRPPTDDDEDDGGMDLLFYGSSLYRTAFRRDATDTTSLR